MNPWYILSLGVVSIIVILLCCYNCEFNCNHDYVNLLLL